MFADEELTHLDDQPLGQSFGPQGVRAVRFDRGDAEFGYREGGVLHPFPSVDLTKWQGDMDYGFRRAPVPTELPSAGDIFPIPQIMSVTLDGSGGIQVGTCRMYYTSPVTWVPDAPGSVNLRYQLTPEGLIR